jgi:hypothetical protein
MNDESSKLSKTLAGYQTTKESFAQTTAGKYFGYLRNLIWLAYLLPLITGAILLILQPTCAISKNPVRVDGCQLVNFDMNAIIAFYARTHVFGIIIVALGILVIKAFFIIKFINAKPTQKAAND